MQRLTITLIQQQHINVGDPDFGVTDAVAFPVENLYSKSLSPVLQAVNLQDYTSKTIRKELPFMKRKQPTLWTQSKFVSTVGTVSPELVNQEQKGK